MISRRTVYESQFHSNPTNVIFEESSNDLIKQMKSIVDEFAFEGKIKIHFLSTKFNPKINSTHKLVSVSKTSPKI